ncbi:glycosyltransferase [Azospirillum brasilense]|uniref:glycosyltransferase n=1 Tax=Azospirillum brasilense TaxID=192 RepID=UPI001EDB6C5E|nr:glycosyltransferase [Azospirillum brasilense]UKJ78122.1 glycosyltransferase [Azospirillum brasilense]
MSDLPPLSSAQRHRYKEADVIFVAQDGFALAPARVRCYSFAKLLRQKGIAAEVLSFVDHLGAKFGGGPVAQIPEEEKLRLNLQAFDILAENPHAVLYVQKAGYHVLSCCMAAARHGNKIIFDYDDYDVDTSPYWRLEPWFPSLRPDVLLSSMTARADACVVSSTKLLELVGRNRPNTHLVHTVADLEDFNPSHRHLPRQRFGDRVNILWCGDVWGSLVLRDIFFAIDAFALIPPDVRAGACFHLIGFGRAWPELKRRVAQRYPDIDNIVFHERIAPERFSEVLAEMDIGVLPYADTMFNACKSPTKMFEYLLAKVAVCATPVGEVVHCLEDGVSVLLADHLEGFSVNLGRLIADHGLRTRVIEAAYERGVRDLSLQGIGDRLVGIVRPLMQADAASAGPSVEDHLAQALGRAQEMSPREVAIARGDLRIVLRAGDLAEIDPMRWTAPLIALLNWPGVERAEAITAQRLGQIKKVAARSRNAVRVRAESNLPLTERPAGPPALSKVTASEDWESPPWFAWVDRYKVGCSTFPRYLDDETTDAPRVNALDRLDLVYNFYKRSCGAWSRGQTVYALDRLGLLTRVQDAAVIASNPDGMPAFLSNIVHHVDAINIGTEASEHARRVARGETDRWRLVSRPCDAERLAVHHLGRLDGADLAGKRWDIVVVPDGAVFLHGFVATMAWIDARLRDEGCLVLTMDVLLNGACGSLCGPTGIPARLATPEGLNRLFEELTGLRVEGAFDGSVSDATLDRVARTDGPGTPHFVRQTGATFHMPAVWTLRKRTFTPMDSWSELAAEVGAV